MHPVKYSICLLLILLSLSCTRRQSDGSQAPREGREPIVKTGLDVVVASGFDFFKGKRVGIVCNHTACDGQGRHIVDLFHDNGDCRVTVIFGPEHGFRGTHADGSTITDEVDSLTGARIFSLYGSNFRPTPEMLKDVDVLVYDIQDVGVRFYTYISTMTYAMQSAFENGIPFVVLDRPNPIRGDRIEGASLEPDYRSFVGSHPTPIRYGLTVGELAMLIYGEGWVPQTVNSSLFVVEMEGWKREIWFDETGLPWIAPSPNMTDLNTAIVYPGFCLLEGTNLSEGRGTPEPFLKFGAPWVNRESLAAALNRLELPGIQFDAATFTPVNIPDRAVHPKYEGQACQGVQVRITDRNELAPVVAMIRILNTIRNLYPDDFEFRDNHLDRLFGSAAFRLQVTNRLPVEPLLERCRRDAEAFGKLGDQYKIYK